PPELDQVLLPKLARALQLLLDPLDLFVLGGQLLLGAPDLLVEFRDLRAQLRPLARPGGAPGRKQVPFALDDARDKRIALPRQQILGKGHLRSTVPLGLVTRATRRQLVEAVPHHLEARADLRVIQPNEEIAGFDAVARADVQLLDDADGRVLHFFDIRIDDDLPRRNDGAREFRGRGPAADAA